jgi:hypothetical protein
MVRCPIELLQSEFRRSEHVRDLLVDSFLAAQVGLDLGQRRRGPNQSGTAYSLPLLLLVRGCNAPWLAALYSSNIRPNH